MKRKRQQIDELQSESATRKGRLSSTSAIAQRRDKKNDSKSEQSEKLKVNAEESQTYKTGSWTVEEHERFIEALTKYGKDWKKIMAHVGTRNRGQMGSYSQFLRNKATKNPQFPNAQLILSVLGK